MTSLLSFPMRLTAEGVFASCDDFDEQYLAEEIAQLVQTQPGERELVPTYGINDPAYSRFDQAMLTAQVATFGPPVRINRVTISVVSDSRQDVVVDFTPVAGGGGERVSYAEALGDPTIEEL